MYITKPFFSICVPAYKAKFFEECLKSILNQDYTNFELLILDDCSPENIEQIVRTFDDVRITYLRNVQNVGSERLVDNWNKLLHLSKGEFIMIMGDDDKLESNFLSTFAELIEENPTIDVYHCRSKIIDENSTAIMLSPSWPEFETVYDTIWHRLNDHRAQYISDFVYRVSHLKQQGGFYDLPLAWGSDDLTAFIAARDRGIVHTNRTVFNYRTNSYSITSTGNGVLKMKAVILFYDWLKEFLEVVPLSEDDKIIHLNLLRNFRKHLQKKKMHTVKMSLGKNSIYELAKWFKNRKKYGLNLKELTYSFIEYIKLRMSKSNY